MNLQETQLRITNLYNRLLLLTGFTEKQYILETKSKFNKIAIQLKEDLTYFAIKGQKIDPSCVSMLDKIIDFTK